MTNRYDPAFPKAADSERSSNAQEGMSIREEFARSNLAGILANPSYPLTLDQSKAVTAARELADLLIRELNNYP